MSFSTEVKSGGATVIDSGTIFSYPIPLYYDQYKPVWYASDEHGRKSIHEADQYQSKPYPISIKLRFKGIDLFTIEFRMESFPSSNILFTRNQSNEKTISYQINKTNSSDHEIIDELATTEDNKSIVIIFSATAKKPTGMQLNYTIYMLPGVIRRES